ncbi:MAG: YceD family protein [Bacillota bacterium]|jgi:uncharacterized protein
MMRRVGFLLTVKISKIKNIVGAKAAFSISKLVNTSTDGDDSWVFDGPVCVTGQMQNKDGIIKITATATANLRVKCDRCTQSFSKKLTVEIDALYALNDDQPDWDGEQNIYGFSGETIDLMPEFSRQIFMAFPLKILCRDDCRGLCPLCGCNLNLNQCSCKDDQIDPRLAKLKEFVFDDEREV